MTQHLRNEACPKCEAPSVIRDGHEGRCCAACWAVWLGANYAKERDREER